MSDEWLIGKHLEESELGPVEILFQDFDGGTAGNNERQL
jgi:hypothetical protein